MTNNISPKAMFSELPTVRFEPIINTCPVCSQSLTLVKTRKKTAANLVIGKFRAHEFIRECKKCKNNNTYYSEELLRLVPYRCRFGYDIIVYVGISLFVHCRNETEIRMDLERKNISISPSEVTYLAKKFIVYLALAHRESRQKIRDFINRQGGYILHLDATCDGDSPHLMTGLDGISEIVLENVKIPSEKADKIIPFLRDIKELYGQPRALVHDMGSGILNAVKVVFPNTPDYICHFHFLRDIGNDLLGKPYKKIRTQLRKHGIQGVLRKRAREFKQVIDKHPSLVDAFQKSMKDKIFREDCLGQIPVVTAYSLILWALEGKQQGQGYGFPFDQPHLTFYERLNVLYTTLNKVNQVKLRKERRDNKSYVKIMRDLYATMNDATLAKAATEMREKIDVFDRLRKAMCIVEPDGDGGLNDDGDQTDIHSIESRVKKFHQWLCHEKALSNKADYKSMLKQIDKYNDKLFADPIIVETPHGQITIQPQRTNNVLERFFRDLKRGYRRRRGTNALSKTLKAMLADTPLVKNIENEDYLRGCLKNHYDASIRLSINRIMPM